MEHALKKLGLSQAQSERAGRCYDFPNWANKGQTITFSGVRYENKCTRYFWIRCFDYKLVLKSAISKLDTAIKSVSSERSKLGAVQNRLEHTINNLGTSSENLTAAESRIRDVDYALAA